MALKSRESWFNAWLRKKYFALLQNIKTGSKGHPTTYPKDWVGGWLGVAAVHSCTFTSI
jgi:hypothetical protein